MLHWREEVTLVEVEMKHALKFFENWACWWEACANAQTNTSPLLQEGLEAYAIEQAWILRSWAHSFEAMWRSPNAGKHSKLMGSGLAWEESEAQSDT